VGQIKKNRFTLSAADSKLNNDLNGNQKQRKPGRFITKKQLFISISLLAITVGAILTLTHFYDKPISFFKSTQTNNSQAAPNTVQGGDKSEIPTDTSDNATLKKAKDNYYRGLHNNAIANFNEVIESDASDTDKAIALTYLGIIENERNNYHKALELYFRALKYNSKNAITYRNIAITYKEQKKYSDALEYINKAIEIDETNYNNLLLKGNIHVLMHKYQDALNIYKQVLDINRDNASALYNSAICYINIGDDTTAADYLLLAAKADKNDKIAYLAYSELGNIALSNNKLSEAAEYLQKAVNINPTDATDHYNLALVYLKQKRTEDALPHLKKAESLSNENTQILENLGLAYQQINDYQKSIEIYQKILKVNNKNINALSQIANIFYKEGKIHEALNAFKSIAEFRPATEHARIAYLNIGNILDDLQRFDEAIEYYKKALIIKPNDDSAYYNMGITYKHANQNEKAIHAWQKASQLNPDNVKPHLALADLLYEVGHLNDAIEEYKKITEKWNNIPEAHFSLANIYHKKDLREYAAQRYQKVINLNSNKNLTIKAYINLGILASEDDKDPQAIAKAHNYLQKALLLQPANSIALLSLGRVYYRQESYNRAIETFYQVIKSTTDKKLISQAYNNIGKAHYKNNEFRQALRAFTLGIEEDPTNEEIRINRKAAQQSYEASLGND
jgi:tetratricopeptide (TPR) repeat protein